MNEYNEALLELRHAVVDLKVQSVRTRDVLGKLTTSSNIPSALGFQRQLQGVKDMINLSHN